MTQSLKQPVLLIAMGWVCIFEPYPSPSQFTLPDLVTALWTAQDLDERREIARAISASEHTFQQVYDALRAGPAYGDRAPTGRVDGEHAVDGIRHPYFVAVPETYDPARAYPVRVFLHGGVRRPAWPGDGQWWREWQAVSGPDFISVFPASWTESPWWSARQIDNVHAILQRLKGDYNIDENRITMVGVSDGGTGAYLFAFRDPTMWAAFLPLIGHPAVLNNPRISDDELYLTNLTGRPFFIVNAVNDRLYPAASMQAFLHAFETVGVDFDFRQPPGGHDVSWWPTEAARMRDFVQSRPRVAMPDRISWETERTDRFNRLHWVRIDRLGPDAAIQTLPHDPFPHRRPSGRIDVVREGNTVTVTTRGVHTFTLLLSPDQFDFAEPVRITTNGVLVEHRIEPDVETLLRWAVQDLDRSMLFGAEVTTTVPMSAGVN